MGGDYSIYLVSANRGCCIRVEIRGERRVRGERVGVCEDR